MKRPQQLLLAMENDSKTKKDTSFGRQGRSFGGSLLKNSHAKSKRPLDSKRPTHLVLRSTLATGPRSFLLVGREVEAVVQRHARKQGLRVYEMANGGNHLHVIVRTPHQRKLYAAFVRGLTGELARLMMGARKGHAVLGKGKVRTAKVGTAKVGANKTKRRFWDQKPFTRVLSGWGRDYVQLKNYLRVNNCETILGMSRKGARSMLYEISKLVASGRLRAVGFG